MNMNKDPISYIFKILRHIIDKNTNYTNSSNDNKIKAWGKCIGQKLRGEEILSFNLLISNELISNELIDILKITEILRMNTHENINNNYNVNDRNDKKFIIFFFENKSIELYIYSYIKYLNEYNYYNNYNNNNHFINDQEIFFSSDNLCIDLNGQISTIIPSTVMSFSSFNWITKCLMDALQKKFTIIVLLEQLDINKQIDINLKYNDMISLGFTYEVLPLFPLNNSILFKNYMDISEFCDKPISNKCAICFENYNNTKDTVLLSCLHDYHINCLHTWTKKNITCPLCRCTIDFKPKTKFGNYEIDHIMENYTL